MATKKIKELRELSVDELKHLLDESYAKLRELRFRKKVEPLENPMEIRNLKKTIARIKTLLREIELQNEREGVN